MRCGRCGADLPADARFCVSCGEPAERSSAERTSPAGRPGGPERDVGDAGGGGRARTPAGPVVPRLVHCPACDAANAASRRLCGRCGAPLRPGEAGVVLSEPDTGAATHDARDSGVPAVLLVVTVLAALAIVGVVLTILSARGVGLFAGPPQPEDTGEPVPVEVVAARASSEVPPAGESRYGPGNVVDGDETTAWKEGASGDGVGEWVELELAGEADLVRLLVWNGYQRPGQFRDHGRVARTRLEIGDRTFTADLLDVQGPQAIELPEVVPADRVRLEILDVHPGLRYEDTAISRLEVLAQPDA